MSERPLYAGLPPASVIHPHRVTTGPWAYGYCRFLRGVRCLVSEVPLYAGLVLY